MTLTRSRFVLNMLITLTLLAAGCSPKTAVAQSQVARDKRPATTPQDVAQVVAGNSAFAFDLYQNLRLEPGNLFFSPYSISSALAMTYAGARGDTQAQMARTLHYPLGQDGLHPAFNALDLDLNTAGSGADKASFTLRSVNSLWAEQDYKFLPAFLDMLGRNYGAGLRLVDYKDSTHREQARLAINDWVKTATANKIPALIDQGVLDENTRLVLANAIYFKGDWYAPFDPNSPAAPFTKLDGSTVTSYLMFRHEQTAYAAGPDYQAVQLPYQGVRTSLVLLLPLAGQFAAFEQSLTADKVAGIVAALKPVEVELFMPRFKYDTSLSLADALKALGMPLAFDAVQADFSGATGQRDLFISNVIHKAYVAVDEKGTEAAAATAVIAVGAGAPVNPSQPIVVKADHPFIFFIRDQQTGSILFVGRVLDPGNS
jgi:serpin B